MNSVYTQRLRGVKKLQCDSRMLILILTVFIQEGMLRETVFPLLSMVLRMRDRIIVSHSINE